jgi:hypothetical protein
MVVSVASGVLIVRGQGMLFSLTLETRGAAPSHCLVR